MEWHFPDNSGGEETGLNDSGIAQFRSEGSLAREVIQNSLDAALDGQPIVVEFRRHTVPTTDVPGWESLGRVVRLCEEEMMSSCRTEAEKTENGRKFFQKADAILKSPHVSVLTIGDSGTRGLEGGLGPDERMSAWYRLLRRQGTSARHGNSGGTFGIGQRAPFGFSDLQTVFYSTVRPAGFAFLGKSILCSFRDPEAGITRRNVGFLGSRRPDGEVDAITDASAVSPAFRRSDRGLDVHVLGYSDDDSWHRRRMTEVLSSFFAAIEHGKLSVVMKDGNREVARVDRASLIEQLEMLVSEGENSLHPTLYYARALRSPLGGAPFTARLPSVGDVSLFVTRELGAPARIAYMRRPRILVYDRAKNIIDNYAAVFICDDDEGNQSLANIEDPTHRKWGRERGGARLINEIQEFVTTILEEIAAREVKQEDDVPDLARYLPDDLPVDDTTPVETCGDGVVQAGEALAGASVAKVESNRGRAGAESGTEGGGGRSRRSGGLPGGHGPDLGGGTGGTGILGGGPTVAHRARTFYRNDGTVILFVAVPDQASYDLRVSAVGEDALVSPVALRKVFDFESGESLDVSNGLVRSVAVGPAGRRLILHPEERIRLSLAVEVHRAG